ncbi:MAG: hypothetical protein BWY31_03138 [Lentisphaerae bacterium ADurb.Bin242]|nr:MAG: hypothetical protein BWY31_03138 [Lentisphaerae bacterium ADurb.Bin242]
MSGKHPVLLIVILAGMLLLVCNMFVQSRLDKTIRDYKLVDEQFVEGAPPLVAFTTVALGGFRGLIADFFWLRAISLQEEGKYFEMVQLASWITKLQPKSTATAAYLAWNMAYNISVTFSMPEDRWRWVNKGIDLYHEALHYNPNDPVLYKELGWIYQHKLGNILDDAQRYYKWQMALQMYQILGEHYPDWGKLMAAPRSEKVLLQRLKDGAKFMEDLQAEDFSSLNALSEAFRNAGGVLPENVSRKFKDPKELELLLSYLRVNWLYDRFMLDPSVVVNINAKYGDLDWFLPESFAIYWATLGAERSPERKNIDCSRMITQSMQVTFTNGRMLYPGKVPSMSFLLIPNLAVVDAVRDSYRQAMKENPTVPSFLHAYQNFMSRAILTMFSYGQYTKAREYYNSLRAEYRGGHKAGHMTFEQFVYSDWKEEMKDAGFKQAQDLIGGMIAKACILLAYGDETAAESHLHLAQICYDRYNAELPDERVSLPPFAQMKSEMAQVIIKSLPEDMASRLKAYVIAESQEKAAEAGTAAEKK